MTEDRGPYHAGDPSGQDLDGVMHVGDIIRQLLERGELPTPATATRHNGHRLDVERRERHE